MRKGFTLVELLIVIVVIGVLSAMMMLSSTEAVSTAKASNIISNLTNLKKAVVAWYVNNLSRVVKLRNSNNTADEYKILNKGNPQTKYTISEFLKNGNGSAEILKYLNNTPISLKAKDNSNEGDYIFIGIDFSKHWYICYNVGNGKSTNARLKEKLASRAKSIGLFGTDDINLNGSTAMEKSYYTNQKFAVLPILKLE